MAIIKVKGTATDVTTATTLSNATFMRVLASTGTPTVTIKDSEGTTKGSFVMVTNVTEYVEKDPTDTIEASSTVSCTAISYRG